MAESEEERYERLRRELQGLTDRFNKHPELDYHLTWLTPPEKTQDRERD